MAISQLLVRRKPVKCLSKARRSLHCSCLNQWRYSFAIYCGQRSGDIAIPADVFLTCCGPAPSERAILIGSGQYQLADGSTVKSDRFIIRELKVGNNVLSDVEASITSVKSTPLLGQSFLSRFSSWALNNDRHVITLVSRGNGETFRGNPRSSPSETTTMALNPLSGPREQSTVLCGRSVDYVLDTMGTGDYAGFVGDWTGTWNNPSRLCGGLIVEKDPTGWRRSGHIHLRLRQNGMETAARNRPDLTRTVHLSRRSRQHVQLPIETRRQSRSRIKGTSGSLIATFNRK